MENDFKKNNAVTQSMQDYLKAIYKFENEDSDLVSTSSIAKELKISNASVTGMLKRLEAMNLIEYNSYKGVKLTDKGRKVAFAIIRRHRLIELFLHKHLKYSLANLHNDACELEHHVSDEFIDKIDALLGYPENDPHGHPIPVKNGKIKKKLMKTLSMAQEGETVIISQISDENPDMLKAFENKGLMHGAIIKIMSKSDFSPIYALLNGKEIVIDLILSDKIYIAD